MFTTLLTALTALAATTLAQGSGRTTFYGGNLNGGMCSFTTLPKLPSGIYGTALSANNWANSANCGACIQVTGPSGKSIKAMVVDQCPECGQNGLDLFQDAFATLANPSTGVIQTNWKYVPCGISSPLQVHLKEGTSQYWFSAQIVNANKVNTALVVTAASSLTPTQAVKDLQISTNGGSTWKGGLKRQPYNFFELTSGTGSATVAVKAISVDGEEVVIKNVPVQAGKSVSASKNFGSGGRKKGHKRHGGRH